MEKIEFIKWILKNLFFAGLLAACLLFVTEYKSSKPTIDYSNIEIRVAAMVNQADCELIGYITPCGDFVNFDQLSSSEFEIDCKEKGWKQIGINRESINIIYE